MVDTEPPLSTTKNSRNLHAFIDESGNRGLTENSTPTFVVAAAVLPEEALDRFSRGWELLKRNIGRGVNQEVSFKNLSERHRAYVSEQLGLFEELSIIAVVVSKRHLPGTEMDYNAKYLFPFRLLLERMSWLSRNQDSLLRYTASHTRGLNPERIAAYLETLNSFETSISWTNLSPDGVTVSTPRAHDFLQVADVVASAVGAAFNPSKRTGAPNQAYLKSLLPRLQCFPNQKLTSYGLKMHPLNHKVREEFPWVSGFEE